jgi:hypothetical protein
MHPALRLRFTEFVRTGPSKTKPGVAMSVRKTVDAGGEKQVPDAGRLSAESSV